MVENILNLLIFAAIIFGVVVHHKRALHVKIMVGCLIADVALLLWVELANSAIFQAYDTASGSGTREGAARVILLIHIAFAILTLVWWVIQARNGIKVLKGNYALLPAHAKNAKIFLVLRFGLLVTAFMV